jgi:thiamine biosynthesis lipoprotein
LDAALAAVHSDAFPVGETLRRPSGVQLTVDGLAKGYIIDAALQAARRVSPDVAGLMINVGGDLRCWGRAPEALGWRVGASAGGDVYDNDAAPVLLRVSDKAVAASGRGARDLVIQGCAASHILSPTSGRPVAHTMGAVVLAPNAADADALATAFMVMSPKAAIALADRLDGVEALITSAAGQRHASAGWAHYEVGGDPLIRTGLISGVDAASSSSAVARSFGLDLAYEVPKLDADPYHAPYVAAWITDENHRMVRTLLLLGKKPKWVTENYIWWRRYGRESPALLDTLAKPTRPPGRYTAHWDGADQDGEKVPPGRYLLHIEAAREKGGHTYETVDIDVGATAGTKTLAPRDELGALDVRYGPAA